MQNWKVEQDYEFKLDERGWAWEFLRRNPEYRKDYHEAAEDYLNKKGPTWLYPSNGGEEPPPWRYGRKWKIRGPIKDPSNDQPPLFLAQYPTEPNLDELTEFYADSPSEDGPVPQASGFATLVFDLQRPIKPQVERAIELLEERHSAISINKPPHKGNDKWPLYLRLLDAKEAGASSADIVKTIKAYSVLGNEAADGYAAFKALSANLKAARSLRARALMILK